VSAALIVTTSGAVECLYTEAIDLTKLGGLSVKRATDIVFDNDSQLWGVWANVGHAVYRHCSREACLEWERDYLDQQETARHGGLK